MIGFLHPTVAAALTHSSWANKHGGVDNERLEFLGDAVLQIVVSDLLFHRFPGEPEGELSRMRRELVKNEHLAPLAREIGLGQALRLAAELEREGGRDRDHILAGALEAMFGAIYLTVGIEEAREVIVALMEPSIEAVRAHRDPRVVLHEWCDVHIGAPPQYRDEASWGPPHQLMFRMSVSAGGERLGEGEGSNKDKARHGAAAMAIALLDSQGRLHAPPPPPPAPPPRKEPKRSPLATLDMWVQRLKIGPIVWEEQARGGSPDSPAHQLVAWAAGERLGAGAGTSKAKAKEGAAIAALAALAGPIAGWKEKK